MVNKNKKRPRKNKGIRARIQIYDPMTGGFETTRDDINEAIADLNNSFLGPKHDMELTLRRKEK